MSLRYITVTRKKTVTYWHFLLPVHYRFLALIGNTVQCVYLFDVFLPKKKKKTRKRLVLDYWICLFMVCLLHIIAVPVIQHSLYVTLFSYPPHSCPANFGYVLLYSTCLCGKKLFSMQGKLVDNKQTHFGKQNFSETITPIDKRCVLLINL